jgi:predicted transcriptional regulator
MSSGKIVGTNMPNGYVTFHTPEMDPNDQYYKKIIDFMKEDENKDGPVSARAIYYHMDYNVGISSSKVKGFLAKMVEKGTIYKKDAKGGVVYYSLQPNMEVQDIGDMVQQYVKKLETDQGYQGVSAYTLNDFLQKHIDEDADPREVLMDMVDDGKIQILSGQHSDFWYTVQFTAQIDPVSSEAKHSEEVEEAKNYIEQMKFIRPQRLGQILGFRQENTQVDYEHGCRRQVVADEQHFGTGLDVHCRLLELAAEVGRTMGTRDCQLLEG